MIRDFIAIDFETANQQPSSVCSIGVVMVRNGQVADSFYSLIQPEPNYYNLPMCFSLTCRQSMIYIIR